MSQAVVCLVSNTVQAVTAVNALHTAGFCNTDVSLLMPDSDGVRDIGYEKHSKAPEGAATGASTGLIVGGALGWLAGIGSLTLPGVGPFIAAGPIMAALSGAAVGSAVGGAGGGLIGLGIPEYEAKQYAGKLMDGKILISVHTDNKAEAKRAEAIFKSAKADEINCVNEEPVKGH